MTVTVAITLLHLRVWFNGLERALGSRWAARGVAGLLIALVTVWLVVGTVSLAEQIPFRAGHPTHLVKPLGAMLFAAPAMTALFISVYSVGSSLVDNMLAVLPVGRNGRVRAARWLAVGLGFIAGVVWTAPLALQFVMSLPVVEALVASVGCLAIVLIGALSSRLLFSIAESLLSSLLRSIQIVNGIAAVLTALFVVWMFLLALPLGPGRDAGGPAGALSTPLSWVADGAPGSIRMLPVYLLVAAVLILAAHLVDGIPRSEVKIHLARRQRLSFARARSLTGLELRQWIRFPANGSFLAFATVLGAVVMIFWGRSLSENQWYALGYLFLALASTVGVGSFGSTRASHWIYASVGRRLAWLFPKLYSVLLLWLIALLAVSGALLVLTPWRVSESLSVLPTLLLELVVGCVVGILLPVSQEQSLGTAFTEVIAIVVVLSVALGLNSLPWVGSTAGLVLTHVFGTMLLLAVYLLLARANARNVLAS